VDDEAAEPSSRGDVVTVILDGRARSAWLESGEPVDRRSVRAGRVITRDSADAAQASAVAAGWVGSLADEGYPSIGRTTLDVEPVQAWLRGAAVVLDPTVALDLWNFQRDGYATSNGRYPRFGRVGWTCHEKLTAATVPWLFSLETYRPTWTPTQLRFLRRVLVDAMVRREPLPAWAGSRS
jgi:hypothetical protein